MLKQEKVFSHRSADRRIVGLHRQYRLHDADYRRHIECFYIALGTPVALSCYMLFVAGEYDQLVLKELNPFDYVEGTRFRDDFAAVSLLRKSASVKTSFNKRAEALLGFTTAEENCKDANIRIKTGAFSGLTPEDFSVIQLQRRKIASILADINIDEVLDNCNWGPGSTLSLRGSDVSGSRKFHTERDITRDAYDLFGDVFSKAYPLWDGFKEVRFQTGNKIVTVPKNAKTDRTIAIEPGLNVWIQLGFGKSIRKRLGRAGFNLNSDLKNQRGAYLGSVNGSLATVDFKAASDTIAIELVRSLLPERWFACLDAARSHYYTLNGVTHRSEKFSTMGNGFTFELESLIFVTLALAICQASNLDDTGVSIFGDDLILPPEGVAQLIRICSYYGLTVNQSKSFSTGPFRESCGSYYFAGLDVKPLFLKKAVNSAKDVYRFANGVRVFAHRVTRETGILGCDGRFRALWRTLANSVPEALKLMGPLSAGDACFSSNIEESRAGRHKDGWEGFTFAGCPTVALCTTNDSLGHLLARLNRPSGDISFGNDVPLRAKTKIVFKKRMFVALWYDLGSWIP